MSKTTDWITLGVIAADGDRRRILITDSGYDPDFGWTDGSVTYFDRLGGAHNCLDNKGGWADEYGGTKTFCGGASGYMFEVPEGGAYLVQGQVTDDGRLTAIKIDLKPFADAD